MIKELLKKVLGSTDLRKRYFRGDFLMFYCFYSGNKITWWQRLWCIALEGHEDLMFLAFRGSAKTTIVRWYVVWCIIYSVEPYIIVQCYEDWLSKAWVREVAKMLMLPKIVNDYGMLFPMSFRREDMNKSSMGSFESTTGVKVEAKSLGGTIRGSNTMSKKGKSSRPTLVVFDDIDVEKSVKNTDIIEDNERKILGETIGALDPVRRRIIFLWNVINEDGIVPRFKKRFKNTWKIFEQWLFEPGGSCVWPEQFTPVVIEKLRGDGERAFAQNYLGIPFSGGDTIIKRSKILYAKELPTGARVTMGIDPAFSTNTGTDEMGLTMTGHVRELRGEKYCDIKYVMKMLGFSGEEKDELKFVASVRQLYDKYWVSMIFIESNNGGEILYRMLKNAGMACTLVKAIKDKVTRLREHEGDFDRGYVYFLPGTEDGVEQLLSFPHGAKDDRVDSMVHSFNKGWWVAFGRA